MTQEALKLALEALEDFADVIKYENEQDDIGRKACCDVLSYKPHYENCKAKQAITAIKEALAQPEQEPVAYLCENAVGHKYFRWKKPSSTYKPIALYTTPPQRTWVGLDEVEIIGCTCECIDEGEFNMDCAIDFARVIEAKLKEKNL